jgi:hypothetical protein
MDTTLAFAVHEHEVPAIEVRVNFGVHTGRSATPAEIDRLAEALLDDVGDVSIIAEERHEIDAEVEASVHQVRIELADNVVPAGPAERDALERRLLERATDWAERCAAERSTAV